ncbi:hypothetical protein LY90DRAFT_631682 [Neocallimastix californiae]|uniref:Uncharacterized protein n=1 Tax=Neocallimastix californiae TaxID=1754190 RepID=A0A1Y2AL13_9FUNG|nr:hypothetical protein LY90DRAFT_631682 [Neocallimastix californiae]|eukprot:ORY22645.1 hypothetical protein LY90DRAFT_631682 [Neocallimastix californiae]
MIDIIFKIRNRVIGRKRIKRSYFFFSFFLRIHYLMIFIHIKYNWGVVHFAKWCIIILLHLIYE